MSTTVKLLWHICREFFPVLIVLLSFSTIAVVIL